MAIRLTETRLRQIIREEARKLAPRRRKLRESDEGGSWQDFFDMIVMVAEDEGFFEMPLDEEVAQEIVERTLEEEDMGDIDPEMMFTYVDALIDQHEERFDPSELSDEEAYAGGAY